MKEFVEVKVVSSLAHDLSSDSESSNDDDEEILLALSELATPTKQLLGCRVNLEDFSPLQCEQFFRYAYIFGSILCDYIDYIIDLERKTFLYCTEPCAYQRSTGVIKVQQLLGWKLC